MKNIKILFSSLVFALCACGEANAEPPLTPPADDSQLSDTELLDLVQHECLNYMWEGADPTSGLAYERIHLDGNYGGDDPLTITTGGSGFGIAGLLVGMERGWIQRSEGVARLQKIVDYLERADRYHGVWSHWMDGPTGKTVPFGKKDNGGDLVESAFLMQALLCARQYMNPALPSEQSVAAGINRLWHSMEFDWYTRALDPETSPQLGGQRGAVAGAPEHVIYWHWSPEYKWEMNFPLEGYNECLIVYILAAASPTHTVPNECYHEGWSRSGGIKSTASPYGYPLEVKHNGQETYGGPLFWAHYSWFGLCPKGLKDQYADYWNVTRNHALANYAYCQANPKKYKGYAPDCWGLTASYSPRGYAAHCANDDQGVITPTAALSSFPYTPEQSMAALRNFYNKGAFLWGKYGPYDAFSLDPTWTLPRYLAIDQLTIAPMIENYRSGLLWRLFMSCPEVKQGLSKLGFTYAGDY